MLHLARVAGSKTAHFLKLYGFPYILINAHLRNFAFFSIVYFFTFETSKSCSSGTKAGMKLILISEDS